MSSLPPLAPRWRRLAAVAIDAILVPALTLLLVMMLGLVEHAEDFRSNLWMLWVLFTAIGAYLLINGVSLWRSGQTFGKRLLGIYVAKNESAQPANFWSLVLLRAWFFPLLFVGVAALAIAPWAALLPLVDTLLVLLPAQRAGHDYLLGTQVRTRI